MKKKLSVLSLLLGLLVSGFALTACGSDDDDNNSGGTPQSSKRVVKVISEEGGEIDESTLSYDSQGRVVGIETTYSSSNRDGYSKKTYQYGDITIITKEVEKKTYSSGQTSSHTETHSYTLENGVIVKDVETQSSVQTRTFTYDSNGYLTSITDKSDNSTTVQKTSWTDGNLTKAEREYGDDRLWTYSNIPWMKGFPFYLKGLNMDEYLFAAGYYGKMPKNLPAQYNLKHLKYDYEMDGNLVTKVIINSESTNVQLATMTFVWE